MAILSKWIMMNFVKYLILVCWTVGCGLLFWSTYIYFRDDPKFFYTQEILGISLSVSRGAAAVLNINCAAILLPMCRACITLFRNFNAKIKMRTVRILIDSSKGFHIYCATIIGCTAVVHVAGHVVNAYNYSNYYNHVYPKVNAAQYPFENPIMILIKTVSGVSGIVMCLVIIFMYSTSLKCYRWKRYNLFWYTHKLFFLFFVCLILHAYMGPIQKQTNTLDHPPGCDYMNITASNISEWSSYNVTNQTCFVYPTFSNIGIETWKWITGPLLLYLLDVLWRLYHRHHLVLVTSVDILPSDVIEISFVNIDKHVTVGQYVLVCCPSISRFEWHPFSITKVPAKDCTDVSVHIRVAGDWALRFKQHIDEMRKQDSAEEFPSTIKLRVDGPLCSPLQDLTKYKNVICIAGGIGITPFVSFIDALGKNLKMVEDVKSVHVIWACRYKACFDWFSTLFLHTFNELCLSDRPDVLKLHLFVTKHKEVKKKSLRRSSKVANILKNPMIQEEVATVLKKAVYNRPEDEFVERNLQNCRPNLHELVTTLYPKHTHDVGVFTCGPHALVEDVKLTQRHCQKTTGSFSFYHESF